MYFSHGVVSGKKLVKVSCAMMRGIVNDTISDVTGNLCSCQIVRPPKMGPVTSVEDAGKDPLIIQDAIANGKALGASIDGIYGDSSIIQDVVTSGIGESSKSFATKAIT